MQLKNSFVSLIFEIIFFLVNLFPKPIFIAMQSFSTFKQVFSFSVILVFAPLLFAQAESKETPKPIDPKNKWGYIVSSSLPKFSADYLETISKSYEILCINGLELNGKGQLRYTSQFVDKVSKSGLKSKDKQKVILYPMIIFSSIRDGIELLNSEKSKRKAIDLIVEFLKDQSFTGVHLDIEYLPPEYDLKLADFLKELKTELNEKNFKLSFAFFPQIDFPSQISKLHNAEKIASSVDEIVLMSYDYHNKKTEAGCVTSLDWTKKNLTYLLKYFKPEQVWLGMPAYGYEWVIDSKRVNIVSARDGEYYEKTWKGTRETSGCLKILRDDKKKQSMIFLADEETRNKMKEVAEEFKIRGTAIWRLGLEEKEE